MSVFGNARIQNYKKPFYFMSNLAMKLSESCEFIYFRMQKKKKNIMT